MKKTSLLALFATLTFTAQAQKLTEKQVPAAALATFKKTYPQVTTVMWEKEQDQYEAGFTQGKAEMSVLLTAAGTLVETETEMPPSQLPAPVRARLARHYQGYKVSEAAKIVTAATGVTTFEAEVTKSGQHRDVLFNADGTEVK